MLSIWLRGKFLVFVFVSLILQATQSTSGSTLHFEPSALSLSTASTILTSCPELVSACAFFQLRVHPGGNQEP